MIRWKLGEIMARHRVSCTDLAAAVGVTQQAISRLRQHETLPRIGGDRWAALAAGISEVAGCEVRPEDLVEFDQ